MTPPAQYQLWWKLTEACSGASGELNRVAWYVVPDARSLPTADGDSVQGLYFPVSHHIVLAGKSAQSGRLVRHEMLHALLGQAGHPIEYFQRRCGGIVACETTCVLDGGPRPAVDATGPIVRPAALTISAHVDPLSSSIGRDSGFLLLTVAVTNARPYAVRLRLTPIASDYWATAATFGFEQSGCSTPPKFNGTTYSYAPDSIVVLGPGETRREGFDLRASGACTILRPRFSLDTLPSVRVDVVP
jgi:hypothetical protein